MTLSIILAAAALPQSYVSGTCPIVENFTLVLFESGSAGLTTQARTLLDGWSQVILGQHFPATVQLIGNADRVGSRQANLRLSFRRVHAVRDYLIEHGVAGHRISIEATGEDRPLVDTADGVPEAQNRLVQLLMLPDAREPRPC